MGTSQSAPPDRGPFSDEEYALVLQSFNKYKDKQHRIHRDQCKALFNLPHHPDFSSHLFDVFKTFTSYCTEEDDDPRPSPNHLSFREFFQGVSACSRSSNKSILRYFFRLFDTDGRGNVSCQKAQEMFQLAYELTFYTYHRPEDAIPDLPTSIFEKSIKRIPDPMTYQSGDGGASGGCQESPPLRFEEFYQWANQAVPLLYECMGGYIYRRVCPGMPIPPSLRFPLPRLLDKSSIIKKNELLFPLGLASATLQGPWYRLYTSEENGLSFNRICHHILGYRGPTVLLCQDTAGHVFGYYTQEMWKESNTFYGGSECFLFRLTPDFGVVRPKYNSDKHFMWLNTKGFTLPHGIGAGGTTESFRLFIPESLETCVAATSCTTFEVGSLASRKTFDLTALEMWGVGGEAIITEALEAQNKARALTAENIAKARKVDKAKFAENEFDREMLLGKTFAQGSAQAGVRADR